MRRLGIDGAEVLRVLNEVDLEAAAGRVPRARWADSEISKGAVDECSEDLLVTRSFSLGRCVRGATMRVSQEKRAHLVIENNAKVQRVCADSLPGEYIGARGGPSRRTTGGGYLVS